MEHLSLLAGGPERSRADWERAASDVLRKAGRLGPDAPDSAVWDALTQRTLDGVAVPPLGTPESVADLPEAGLPGQAPYTRGRVVTSPDRGWDVRAHLVDPDAARSAADALTDLENGVTSLWLSLGRGGIAVDDLPTVLDGVHLDLAPVVLDCPPDPVGAAEALATVLRQKAVAAAAGTGLGGDPVGACVTGRGGTAVEADGYVAATVLRLAGIAREHGTSALTVDGSVLHDLGATDAQELGYTLAVGTTYLRLLTREAGLSVEDAARLIDFRYAVTDEQLPSMAKLRAARRSWHRVLELCGAPGADGQVQHAVTSRPMMTKHDPWVNMLRATVAAFAAGVGGASSVTVLPFDSMIGLPDAFSRRIARNTSSLLIWESHVARVTDPAGGSFAVEQLTDAVARAGWEQLQRIEAEGGVEASVRTEDDGLLDRVTRAAEERWRQVATRRRPLTGLSEFPDPDEVLPSRRPWPAGAWTAEQARHGRWFEQLRDQPAATPVFLATMGTLAQHTTPAGFAANLFASGGVDTVPAGPTSDPDDVLAAYGGQSVVCLAGTDPAYAAWGADLVAALRDAGARYVVVAGRPDESLGVDDSCAAGDDVLAFLDRVREELAR